MSSANVMWVEKYRPKKISELVNQKEIVNSIKSLLKNQSEMPHLLFSGSAGVGKTTTALCISREILGEYWQDYTLELNASDERGINMVRERVKKFSRFAGLDTKIPFKVIILDEADEMTSDAQTALRRIIEDASNKISEKLLFNLWNLALQDNKYLLITSEKPINGYKFELPDLTSRVKSCIIIEIKKPNDDLMSVILAKNFSDRQIGIEKKHVNKKQFMTTSNFEFYHCTVVPFLKRGTPKLLML